MGEESLMGKDVNFVFRMEKLAGSLGIPLLISAAGKLRLESLIKCEPAGDHELKRLRRQTRIFQLLASVRRIPRARARVGGASAIPPIEGITSAVQSVVF
jgi:class 3 adenylate cyclase